MKQHTATFEGWLHIEIIGDSVTGFVRTLYFGSLAILEVSCLCPPAKTLQSLFDKAPAMPVRRVLYSRKLEL